MEQITNNTTHNGVRTNVGVKPAMNRTVRCEGKGIGHCGVAQVVGTVNFIEDEETRKFFTDDDGVYHSVVFTDPDTGERRFG